MRTVDGMKVAFIGSESYFSSLHTTPSMYITAKETGADIVFILPVGKIGDDLTDDDIRELLVALRQEEYK